MAGSWARDPLFSQVRARIADSGAGLRRRYGAGSGGARADAAPTPVTGHQVPTRSRSRQQPAHTPSISP